MVYIIFICIALPLLLMLPFLEKRSRCLVVFLLLGAFTALAAYEVNTLIYPYTALTPKDFTYVVPPLAEELLKALPVLFYAVLLDDRRKSVLPIAMAVGIGFAIVENTVILVQNIDYVTIPWAALRGISASLMHGLCTMIIGAGVTYVKKQKKLFYTGIFGLLSIAVTLHSMFNLFIQSEYDYIGMLMPPLIYTLIYFTRKSGRINLPFLSY